MLYVVTTQRVLYKSTDGGASWSVLEVGAYDMVEITALTIDPVESSILYLGVSIYDEDAPLPLTILKSIDGGSTWNETGLSAWITALAVDPVAHDTIYAVNADYTVGISIYKSQDGGSSWLPLDGAPRSARFLAIYSTDPATLYVGTEFMGVYKSVDGGVSWIPTPVGSEFTVFLSLAIDSQSPDNVYAASFPDGIYKSSDGGESWSVIDRGVIAQRISFVIPSPTDPSIAYAVSYRSGVYRSDNGGASWIRVSSRIQINSLWVDRIDPLTVYVSSLVGTVSKSSDGGSTWTTVGSVHPIPGGVLFLSFIVNAPSDPSTLYASASNYAFMLRSNDGGVSWTPLRGFSSSVNSIAIDPQDSSTVYAVSWGRLYKSLDGGENWNILEINNAPFGLGLVVTDPQIPSIVYAGFQNGLLKSTDGGTTWVSLGDGLVGGRLVQDLAVDPADSSVLYLLADFPPSLYRSNDGGEHWIPWDQGFGGAPVSDLSVGPAPSRTVYAASIGVYDIGPSCVPDSDTLCIADRAGAQRFDVELSYDTALGGGREGQAGVVALASVDVTQGGIFWFFDPQNPEAMVKVLDGCAINGHYWVFSAATSTAGFTMAVRDRMTGQEKVYTNPDGTPAVPIVDTEAFATCSSAADPPLSHSQPEVSIRPGTSRTAHKTTASCISDGEILCIDNVPGDGRFKVTAQYSTSLGGGREGEAGKIELSAVGISRGGILWFFDPHNPEVLVKVLDGCAINGHFWLFYAATTTAGFNLTVADTLAGVEKNFTNVDLNPATPVTDIEAFATCDL